MRLDEEMGSAGEQPVNNRLANVLQAAIADSRGKVLHASEVVEYFFSIGCRLHLIPMLTEFVLGYIITIG